MVAESACSTAAESNGELLRDGPARAVMPLNQHLQPRQRHLRLDVQPHQAQQWFTQLMHAGSAIAAATEWLCATCWTMRRRSGRCWPGLARQQGARGVRAPEEWAVERTLSDQHCQVAGCSTMRCSWLQSPRIKALNSATGPCPARAALTRCCIPAPFAGPTLCRPRHAASRLLT